MDLINYLASDNYIIVNKTLIKTFGLNEAILIGELCTEYKYWAKENKLEDDMFYSTIDNIEENTGLTAHEQRQAIKSLENAGVLYTELKGVPAKKYFRIDVDSVVKILTTSHADFSQLDVKKLHSNNNNKNNNKEKLSISKDIDNTKFEFGAKTKTKKLSLWDKCVSLIDEFTDDMILREFLIEFLKVLLDNSRESGKPFYTNTFKGKLNKLKSLSDDNYIQRKIVVQTLDNGWSGFYELKTDTKKNNTHDRLNESGDLLVEHSDKRKRGNIDGAKF